MPKITVDCPGRVIMASGNLFQHNKRKFWRFYPIHIVTKWYHPNHHGLCLTHSIIMDSCQCNETLYYKQQSLLKRSRMFFLLKLFFTQSEIIQILPTRISTWIINPFIVTILFLAPYESTVLISLIIWFTIIPVCVNDLWSFRPFKLTLYTK